MAFEKKVRQAARFIDKFRNNDKVRYIFPPSEKGVYHPKVYLFENGNGAWECIIGSPNFTRFAFEKNRETAVLISSDDNNAMDAYSTIDRIITADWNNGKQIDEVAFEEYKKNRENRPNSTQEPSDQQDSQRAEIFDILYISWPKYYQLITTEDKSLKERLEVLKFAQKRFLQEIPFNKLDTLEKKRIAGLIKDDEADWKFFGSTGSSGLFAHAIIVNNQNISEALDKIPIKGEVYKKDYENYIQEFSQVKGGGLATATRLLAMKRPDYFLCVNGKNKNELCEDFDIPKNITVENYWGRVVEKVKHCAWWQAEKPKDLEGLSVWESRTALLDVLYYRP